MRSGHLIFVTAVVGVAAVSFGAGRMITKFSADRAPAVEKKSAPDRYASQTPSLPPAVPPHVPDVVNMPFRETYELFKTASDETLRSYFAELQQRRPKPTRYAALVSFFKTLIHVNPRLTTELISRLNKDDRWPAMYAIRDVSPPRGMQAIAEVLLSFDRIEISSCSWDMLRETLDEWGRNDPLALKEFLETHRDQDVDRYFPKLLRNWAAYDPEAAQKWMREIIQNHPPPPPDDTTMASERWTEMTSEMGIAWIEGFLENDRDAAINYVLEHIAEPIVADAVNAFAGDLFIMSPDQARDFLSRLPREQQLAGLNGISLKADRTVLSNAPDNTTSPRFIAEWILKSFPDNSERFDWVLGEWKYADSQEMFAWMAELPASTRAAVVRRFHTYVSNDEPSEDFDLIMQARNPVVRDGLLETLARNATSNGKALLGVLEKSALPPSQKAHLAALIPPEPTPFPEASEDR